MQPLTKITRPKVYFIDCPDCKGSGKDYSDYCTELGDPKCERCEGEGCIEEGETWALS